MTPQTSLVIAGQTLDGTVVPIQVDSAGVLQSTGGGAGTGGTGGTVTQGTAAAATAPWPVKLSDGTVAIGVAGHPVRTDPTGDTAQPVTGTVAVSGTVPVSIAGTLPVSIAAAVPVTVAATLPVSIAATVRTDPTGTTAQPVSGTVAVSGTVPVSIAAAVPVTVAATLPVSIAATVRTDPTGTTAQPVTGTVAVSGTVPVSVAATVRTDPTGTTPQPVTIAATVPVSIAATVRTDPVGTTAQPVTIAATVRTDPIGTTAQPVTIAATVRTDPVGTTAQPVTGTVAVSGTVPVSIAASVPVTVAATLPVSIAATVATSMASIAASAAAGDAVANPTAGLLQSLSLAFNGASWDRIRAGVVGVQTTFTGLLNALSMARYNATPPTLADGNVAPLQANTTGALKVVLADVETVSFDLTTTTSSSASTTTVSSTVTGLSNATAFSIEGTFQGNTGGTLDLYLQHTPNGGTDWFDYAHWAQIAAGAAVSTQIYVPGINDKVTALGKGTAGAPGVALAANTFVGGHLFDAARMVMVTGAGTTAGKSQVLKIHATRPKA